MNERKLLILHGWGSNSLRWQKVRELLEKKGIEILVLDLPGFGLSPSPDRPWGKDDYINWIFQKLKEKKWQKFNLLGHSFGGALAAKIAVLYPGQIEKLILCAPAIIRRKSIKVKFFYWFSSLGKKFFSLPGLKTFYPLAQKLIYILAGTRDYYVADGIMKETMRKIMKEGSLEEFLGKIKIPTLIIWGEKDDVLPLKDAYLIKEKITDSKLEILPKIGHNPHTESPELLVEKILETI